MAGSSNSPKSLVKTVEDEIINLGKVKWSTFGLLKEKIDDRSITRMVCLGIGSMENDSRSFNQFSFAILLARNLGLHLSSVMVYDPEMTAKDTKLVQNIGCRVGKNELDFDPSISGENREGIIMYIPFLCVDVIETILQRIIEKGSIANTIFLTASLSDFLTNAASNFRPLWFKKVIGSERYKEQRCENGTGVPPDLSGLCVVSFE